MYSERVLDHFRSPRNVGDLPEPAVMIEVENPACGDVLRLSARVENGRIAEARYKVRGCTASIACGSALTEILTGLPVGELWEVDAPRISFTVGGLAAESAHAAVLCADAVRALIRVVL